MLESYITAAEAERLMNLPKGSVRRDIHRGKIKAQKFGRDWFVNRDVIKYVYGKGKGDVGSIKG